MMVSSSYSSPLTRRVQRHRNMSVLIRANSAETPPTIPQTISRATLSEPQSFAAPDIESTAAWEAPTASQSGFAETDSGESMIESAANIDHGPSVVQRTVGLMANALGGAATRLQRLANPSRTSTARRSQAATPTPTTRQQQGLAPILRSSTSPAARSPSRATPIVAPTSTAATVARVPSVPASVTNVSPAVTPTPAINRATVEAATPTPVVRHTAPSATAVAPVPPVARQAVHPQSIAQRTTPTTPVAAPSIPVVAALQQTPPVSPSGTPTITAQRASIGHSVAPTQAVAKQTSALPTNTPPFITQRSADVHAASAQSVTSQQVQRAASGPSPTTQSTTPTTPTVRQRMTPPAPVGNINNDLYEPAQTPTLPGVSAPPIQRTVSTANDSTETVSPQERNLRNIMRRHQHKIASGEPYVKNKVQAGWLKDALDNSKPTTHTKRVQRKKRKDGAAERRKQFASAPPPRRPRSAVTYMPSETAQRKPRQPFGSARLPSEPAEADNSMPTDIQMAAMPEPNYSAESIESVESMNSAAANSVSLDTALGLSPADKHEVTDAAAIPTPADSPLLQRRPESDNPIKNVASRVQSERATDSSIELVLPRRKRPTHATSAVAQRQADTATGNNASFEHSTSDTAAIPTLETPALNLQRSAQNTQSDPKANALSVDPISAELSGQPETVARSAAVNTQIGQSSAASSTPTNTPAPNDLGTSYASQSNPVQRKVDTDDERVSTTNTHPSPPAQTIVTARTDVQSNAISHTNYHSTSVNQGIQRDAVGKPISANEPFPTEFQRVQTPPTLADQSVQRAASTPTAETVQTSGQNNIINRAVGNSVSTDHAARRDIVSKPSNTNSASLTQFQAVQTQPGRIEQPVQRTTGVPTEAQGTTSRGAKEAQASIPNRQGIQHAETNSAYVQDSATSIQRSVAPSPQSGDETFGDSSVSSTSVARQTNLDKSDTAISTQQATSTSPIAVSSSSNESIMRSMVETMQREVTHSSAAQHTPTSTTQQMMRAPFASLTTDAASNSAEVNQSSTPSSFAAAPVGKSSVPSDKTPTIQTERIQSATSSDLQRGASFPITPMTGDSQDNGLVLPVHQPLSSLPFVQRRVDSAKNTFAFGESAQSNSLDEQAFGDTFNAVPTAPTSVQRSVATEIGDLPSVLWQDIGLDAPSARHPAQTTASQPQSIARHALEKPHEAVPSGRSIQTRTASQNETGEHTSDVSLPPIQRTNSAEAIDTRVNTVYRSESFAESPNLNTVFTPNIGMPAQINQSPNERPNLHQAASPPPPKVVQRSLVDYSDSDAGYEAFTSSVEPSAPLTNSHPLSQLPFIQREAKTNHAESRTVETDFGNLPAQLWRDIGISPPSHEPTVQREVSTEIGELPSALWGDIGVDPPSPGPDVQRQPIVEHFSAEPNTVQRKITQDGTSTPVGEDSSADDQEESLLEDPEDEANDEPEVDIEELSRKVYQKIRHRISLEWERGRGY